MNLIPRAPRRFMSFDPELSEGIDRKSYMLASLLPMYLDQLRAGEYSEISITVQTDNDETTFILNAVSHQTCEEHGCQDDDCRLIQHQNSIAIPMRNLDQIIDALFYSMHKKKPSSSAKIKNKISIS